MMTLMMMMMKHLTINENLFACEDDAKWVWPGEELILLPPSLHHQTHVEAEHEGEGDVGQVVGAVQS